MVRDSTRRRYSCGMARGVHVDDPDVCVSLRFFHCGSCIMLASPSQMLSCIEAVHREGYIHRDVKPSNFVFGVERYVDGCVQLSLEQHSASRVLSHVESDLVSHRSTLLPCSLRTVACVQPV